MSAGTAVNKNAKFRNRLVTGRPNRFSCGTDTDWAYPGKWSSKGLTKGSEILPAAFPAFGQPPWCVNTEELAINHRPCWLTKP